VAIIIKLKNFVKNHFYVFVLLAFALFFFQNILSASKIMMNVHYINDVTFYSYNIKEALKNNQLPLWTPYYYSGRPLYAQPEYYFIDFNLLLVALTKNIYLAMNFSAIIHLFIAGIGMYFLANYLSGSRKAAFISALIYMFNGFVHTFVVPGNIMIIEGYSLVPLIILFYIKALKEKNFIFNSAIAGIFAAMLIFVGGVIFFPYLFLLIAAYSIIYLIDNNFTSRILKLALVGVIISAVGFGISAIKLLPDIEFMNLSNRGIGLPYQEYLGEPINLENFVYLFITNVISSGSGISAAIGIAGFVLLIFGLSKFRNKIVLFSILIIIISLLMSSDSFLTKLLYKIPVFNQTRHVERSVFLFAFASSILAGFGFLRMQSLTDKYKKIIQTAAYLLIVVLIFSELIFLQEIPKSIKSIQPNEIPILDYMGKDKSQFRTINTALSTLVGASGYNYYSQFGISEIKGGSGIWFNDYLDYLLVAQNSPAKLWGVLNNKYVIMSQNASIEGLSFVQKFNDCSNCPIWESYGPYLFKNEFFLPRYYIVPNSILVVGDSTMVKQLIYSLMLHNWEPKNTVLIEGTKINDYDIAFLKKFNFIILLKDSVDHGSIQKLREYKSQGGVIIPNILSGENSISNEGITSVLNRTGTYTELNVEEYSNNKVAISLNGKKGWLIASERFAYFPGWTASVDGTKTDILKADNAVSAVYLDGEKGNLIFEYKPNSYKYGKIISISALIILIVCLVYLVYSKHKVGGLNQN